MENVVIIDAVRTPMGRSKGGAFRHVRAEDGGIPALMLMRFLHQQFRQFIQATECAVAPGLIDIKAGIPPPNQLTKPR
jgi:hypothetical protein